MLLLIGLAGCLIVIPRFWQHPPRSQWLGIGLALCCALAGLSIVLQYQADGLILGSVAGILASGFAVRAYQATRST